MERDESRGDLMLSRELFADALQGAADEPSPLRDRGYASTVADQCLRLFETQSDVAAEIRRTGGGAGFTSTVRDDEVPDIRMYDAAEYTHAHRAGRLPAPLPLTAVTRRARNRMAS